MQHKDKNEKTIKKLGRPVKGMPEPLNMTAEQLAKTMFKLKPEKTKENA